MNTNTEVKNLHIHEILNALYDDQTPRTLEALKTYICEKFGSSSLFFSCSQQNMNVDGAIEFMMMREKIAEVTPGQYAINTGNSCGH